MESNCVLTKQFLKIRAKIKLYGSNRIHRQHVRTTRFLFSIFRWVKGSWIYLVPNELLPSKEHSQSLLIVKLLLHSPNDYGYENLNSDRLATFERNMTALTHVLAAPPLASNVLGFRRFGHTPNWTWSRACKSNTTFKIRVKFST